MFGCRTDGKTIIVSDERDKTARYEIRQVEWGIWRVANGALLPVSLCWSKWDMPFSASTACRMAKISIPTRRLVVLGSGESVKKNRLLRAFPVGASICELYVHMGANGLAVGATIIPVSDGLWDRPLLSSTEPRRKHPDNSSRDPISHH